MPYASSLARSVAAVALSVPLSLAPAASAPARLAASNCATAAKTMIHVTPWAQVWLYPQHAWALSEGAGITVAVLDAGVDAGVPQLAGRVKPGINTVAGGGNADADCTGSGTFSAGIIAAASLPNTDFAGIAPQATILPIRVTTDGVDETPTTVAAGIVAAVQSGAQVIDVSAGPVPASATLRAAVDYALAKDVVIVAGTGTGQSSNALYPAQYRGVVAVGSISPGGIATQNAQPGVRTDLVAPGSDVVSLGVRGPGDVEDSGTADAAAFVAGAAALVRAYYPHLTGAQVVAQLEASADPPSTYLPDPQFGWGIVDPYADLAIAPAGPAASATPRPPGQVRIPAAVHVASQHRLRTHAWIFTGVVSGLAAIAAIAAVIIPRGRRRGWQPGRRDTLSLR